MQRLPCVLIVVLTLFLASRAGAQERPNILWITAEDMSADLGSWGDEYAITPNLDRLAREGVRFTDVFATAPACSPARSSLILGVYPTSAGTHHLRSRAPIPDAFRGFPAFLRESGYYTTNNVKTDYNTSAEERLVAESWDESSPRAHWRGRDEGQPFFAVFNLMHTHQSRTSFTHEEYAELAPGLGTHDPAEAPVPPYYPDTPLVREMLARHYDAVTAMDHRAGEILAQLEADGLADETIVFFFTDHGRGLPRGKRTLYDSGLHVPLIVRVPPRYREFDPAPAGGAVGGLVSFVDFAPTVLRMAGLEVPAHMQGRVFLGPDAAPAPEHLFAVRDRIDEAYETSRAVRSERYLYIRNYRPHRSWKQPEFYSDQSAMRRELTRLAEAGRLDAAQRTYAGPTKPVEELYDTLRDPHQLDNLAGSLAHRDVLLAMRVRLRAWQLESRDVGLMPEGEMLRRARAGSTPWEIARDETAYPLARILDVAGLVGRPVALAEQRRLLTDPDPSVRYWAAVGLRAAGAAAAPALPALTAALDDPVADVRIEAAGAVVALAAPGEAPRALGVLVDALGGDDLPVIVQAARTLQLLGERARPARAAMERALKDAQGGGEYEMYVRFSLEPALAALGDPAPAGG